MKEIKLPPTWCSSICRNSMNEVCVEDCAIKRDAEWFEVKEIALEDMPRFPLKDFTNGDMTPKERQVCAGVYLAKVVDKMQGVTDGQNVNRVRSRRIPTALKVSGVLYDSTQGNTVHQIERKKDSNTGDGSGKVG